MHAQQGGDDSSVLLGVREVFVQYEIISKMMLPNTGDGAVEGPEKKFLDVQGSGLRQHFSDVALNEGAYWLSNTRMADRAQGFQDG